MAWKDLDFHIKKRPLLKFFNMNSHYIFNNSSPRGKMTVDQILQELDSLLDLVAEAIHQAQNRMRYTMNGFVIAVGGYISDLSAKAIYVAKKSAGCRWIWAARRARFPMRRSTFRNR